MIHKPRTYLALLFAFLAASGLILSLFTLTSYPAIHSDEVWLADLSREILSSGNPWVTESFLRLTPRYPHAIKTLYHQIQGMFLQRSFSPPGARLPSYLAGLLVLAGAAWAARKTMLLNSWWAAVPLFILWNLQFIYASHFGRQEIFLLAIFMGGYAVLKSSRPGWKQGVLLGLVTAPGIFIHPNSFIIALALGIMLVYRDFSDRERRNIPPGPGMTGWFFYGGILGVTAAAAVLISLNWDPDFLTHYQDFGDNHGVSLPLFLKLRRLPRFFYKMYIQAAGTYYLPPVKGVMIIGAGSLIIRPILGVLTKTPRPLETTAGTLGLAAGLMLIGKYSPPSLIFFFPLTAFALVESLVLAGRLIGDSGRSRPSEMNRHSGRPRRSERPRRSGRPLLQAALPVILGTAFFLLQAGSTVAELGRQRESAAEYQRYARFLSEALPPGEKVLANLNTGFILDTRNVHPYRDLAFLPQRGLGITEYLDRENINWVVWPEEMKIIYAERPVWNDLYGNLYPYFDELYDILKTSTPVARGYFPVYGMRIIPYQGRRGGQVTVYRLNRP